MHLSLQRTATEDGTFHPQCSRKSPRRGPGNQEAEANGIALKTLLGPAVHTKAAPGAAPHGLSRTTPTDFEMCSTRHGITRAVRLGRSLIGAPLEHGDALGPTDTGSRSHGRTRGPNRATTLSKRALTTSVRPPGVQRLRGGPGHGQKHHPFTPGRNSDLGVSPALAPLLKALEPPLVSLFSSSKRFPRAGLRPGSVGASCARFLGQAIGPTTLRWSTKKLLPSSGNFRWMTYYGNGKSAQGRTLQHLTRADEAHDGLETNGKVAGRATRARAARGDDSPSVWPHGRTGPMRHTSGPEIPVTISTLLLSYHSVSAAPLWLKPVAPRTCPY